MGHPYLTIGPPCLNLWLVASSPALSSLTTYADKTSEVLINSSQPHFIPPPCTILTSSDTFLPYRFHN